MDDSGSEVPGACGWGGGVRRGGASVRKVAPPVPRAEPGACGCLSGFRYQHLQRVRYDSNLEEGLRGQTTMTLHAPGGHGNIPGLGTDTCTGRCFQLQCRVAELEDLIQTGPNNEEAQESGSRRRWIQLV